jgi:asparagine synthetase B (glutamine-hydrolysing)
MSRHLNAKLRYARLTRENSCDTFRQYASSHVGPVVDYVVPLKYALAKATRAVGVTGEGGDPLFSGAKNNFVVYLRSRFPELYIGKVHAMAHKRLYAHMPEVLERGEELCGFAESYLADILDRYPGDLVRKLFYVNTFEKQGGMIFPKNYYAGRRYDVQVFHPLTSLGVYRAAFSLADERKYAYPLGKLALIELYRSELPDAIVARRKSGTRLPLDAYLGYLIDGGANLDALKETGFFKEEKLDRLWSDGAKRRGDLVLLYGLLSLSAWIACNGKAA